MKKTIINGGAGFIGLHVVHLFVNNSQIFLKINDLFCFLLI